eukprot:gene10258-biopygen7123
MPYAIRHICVCCMCRRFDVIEPAAKTGTGSEEGLQELSKLLRSMIPDGKLRRFDPDDNSSDDDDDGDDDEMPDDDDDFDDELNDDDDLDDDSD